LIDKALLINLLRTKRVFNGGIGISIGLVRGIMADRYEWSERAGSLAKGSAGVTMPWEVNGMNEGGFLEAS